MLSPRYVGPYEIVKKIGKVAYKLNLPLDMSSIHLIFHVSMLRKLIGDPNSIVPLEGVGLKRAYPMKKFRLKFWIGR